MHRDTARRRGTDRRWAAAALLLLGAPAAAGTAAHDYTVTVDGDLGTLRVAARFGGLVGDLNARSPEAARLLLDARTCGPDSGSVLREGRMALPDEGVRCLTYVVDLARAAREDRRNDSLSADNVLVSPSAWLWRPEPAGNTDIRVRFDLPGAMRVAVPWEPDADDPDTFLLRRSPESSNAAAVFGAFDYHELDVPGALLRVSLLHGEPALDADRVLRWITATATDITLAYGRFPNPSPQVLVMPGAGRRSDERSAVPFGRVVRDGGESVELFVDQRAPLADLLGDWTATHEFSHLLLPYLSGRHRWVSEGFAQYYQNVLLARSGAYDARYAWQKIHDGLGRGRLSRPELSPNEASGERRRGALMKVYWSGAAIALMADVTLRERSNGRESLDDVLDRLQACCLPSAAVWSGPELFAKLDSMLDAPVFMPLYERHADTAGFPDMTDLFRRLGLDDLEGEIRLGPDAELAGIRDSITAADPLAARQRRRLSGSDGLGRQR